MIYFSIIFQIPSFSGLLLIANELKVKFVSISQFRCLYYVALVSPQLIISNVSTLSLLIAGKYGTRATSSGITFIPNFFEIG
jgi:hypothetical protein